jgi:hypothetical protein
MEAFAGAALPSADAAGACFFWQLISDAAIMAQIPATAHTLVIKVFLILMIILLHD